MLFRDYFFIFLSSYAISNCAIASSVTPILSCQDLQNIGNNLTEQYTLSNDIDCTGFNFLPIGTLNAPFSGILDGNGHKISNLTISQTNYYTGLFGVTENAKISNINLDHVNIRGTWYVGSLIGSAEDTKISQVSSSGAVTGQYSTSGLYYFGGLVGYLKGKSSIDQSYSSVTLSPDLNSPAQFVIVGGLVGAVQAKSSSAEPSITNSHATGNIKGSGNLGGLVGDLEGGTIIKSYATGALNQYRNTSMSNNYGGSVGGLIGYISMGYAYPTKIQQCYATGNINQNYVQGSVQGGGFGGLIGYMSGGSPVYCDPVGSSTIAVVINNFAKGSVIGGFKVAGLIGYTDWVQVINNYSSGHVMAVTSSKPADANGLAVEGPCTYHQYNTTYKYTNFWDTQTSGIPKSTSSVDDYLQQGFPTAQMYQKNTYTGWDFNNTWFINEGHDYPCLVGVSCN